MPTAWDDGVLSARVIALAAHSVGFGAAATGRLFRVPRLPSAVAAPIVLLDYQPALRRLLEAGIGRPRTDLLLSTLTAASFTLVQAPPLLAIEALLRASVVGEVLANRRAWLRSTHRPVPETAAPDLAAAGPVDRHLERAAWAQLGGVSAVGAATGSVRAAGTAALVTAPKAARTARESFASTLGRGLADDHGVLCRGPDVLRRLDAVTALVVDPRALLTADLRVSRIRGVDDHRRAGVWEAARTAIESGELDTGWHSLAGIDNAADPGDDPDAAVLISPSATRWRAPCSNRPAKRASPCTPSTTRRWARCARRSTTSESPAIPPIPTSGRPSNACRNPGRPSPCWASTAPEPCSPPT
ncbi:hypothetical protein ACQ86I_05505 [Prescottella equi]